jgi:hypothetical protein
MHIPMIPRYVWLQVGLVLGLSGGCFDPNAPGLCATGSDGCKCTSGGSCDPGLVCSADVCVPSTTMATDGVGEESGNDGESTGDGDGDGESTGDGDGDGESTGDGDGDGDGDGEPDCMGTGEIGAICTANDECASCKCYVVPFLGGQCGECISDADCVAVTDGGCSPPNPFTNDGPTCNWGEAGGGCESDDVCMDGLTCESVFSLLGVVEINTCGECASDADCVAPEIVDDMVVDGNDICVPIVDMMTFNGQNTCVDPYSLPKDSYCNLDGNGHEACQTGICSAVDIMGLALIGACGECNSDADCWVGTCEMGTFDSGVGELTGSICL